MAAIQATQQKLARMPCRRPSMRQRNVGIGRYCGDADVRARFLAMGCSGMQYLQGTGQSPIHPDGSEATVRVGHFTPRCWRGVRLAWDLAQWPRRLTLVASATVAAQDARKKGDSVRVTDDQMHQLGIVKVELYPFRVQKLGHRPDRLQRGHQHRRPDAVLRPRDPADRQDRRQRQARRSAVRDRQPRSGAAAERFHRRAHCDEQGALAAQSRADRREAVQGSVRGQGRARSRNISRRRRQLVGAENDMRSAEMSLEAARAPAAHRRPHRRGGRDA